MGLPDTLYKEVLGSGLTLLFQPMKHSASLGVGLFLRHGSLSELPGEHGYFHFLEHMLFKDSETRTSKESAQEIERVGGVLNGSTSREYTQYYVVCMKEKASLAFDILSDMVFRPKFLPKDIETEKEVVIEEMRSYEDAPDEFIYDYYFRNTYQGSNYGKDIIGTKESIRSITRPKLLQFYEKHYGLSNMILSVSGNLSWNQVLDLTESYFSDKRKKPKKGELASLPKAPPMHFNKNLQKRKIEQFNIMLGTKGRPREFTNVTQLQTISTILGGGMASRLFQNIRESEGLCYSIYSFPTFYKTTGVFSISCATSKEKADRCVRLILGELRSLVEKGFTKKELEDAKTNQLGSMAINSELPEHRMNMIGLLEIYFGRYYTIEDRKKAVQNLKLEEINQTAKELFFRESFQLSCVGDLSDSQFRKIPNSWQNL